MSSSAKAINIRIMERDYKIKCPQDKLKELQEAAKFVDKRMRELRKSGNVLGADKAAVLTALNICSEYLSLKQQNTSYIELMNQRLQSLHDKIETAVQSANHDSIADEQPSIDALMLEGDDIA